ncbi:prepilin-type N-terminal cleavage/methylation domain-containing protein [Lysinibacillus sp. SGAir0095]|uniref:prepilin-type N-terminal cleavage/methylation domain-containing protein n=1 Tax=Lysinibacillus sp. SGAir0095 TaxID=2070463 RepID=UPI0010CD59D6|nr:prepilin-type N-terminal cleavage/methylation domain-containing protein [Lysinibacillus sp. SGAir0095]QCR32032.1 type II secretory pathway protein [Lysinibacillus sp. SGAir0095]
MQKPLQNPKGFTLIEVVASIIIITIILLSISQLFIQTNRTAVTNTEKLVTINLADAMLERVRAKTYTKATDIQRYFVDTTQTNKKLKNPPLEIDLNGRTNTVSYKSSQSTTKSKNATYTEKDLNLIKVVVTVTSPNGTTKGSSEGYVSID